MHPVLFRIPILDWPIHTYGLMIAIGFLLGMQLGAREARRIDASPERTFEGFIHDLTFWILIAAMVGARLLFIAVEWDDYARAPLKIFKIWEGGLVFYGGFIGSVLFSIYYARKKGRNFFLVSDVLIPSVALGHFFGRIGCFAAGCCWGGTVSSEFPFAVQFPEGGLIFSSMRNEGLISPDAAHTLHVHPVQLYEAFGELAIFFLLLAVRSRKRFHGQMLLTYLFAYPILRTTLEFFRGDRIRGVYSVFGVDVSTSQIISTVIACIALALLVVFVRKRHVEHRALVAPA